MKKKIINVLWIISMLTWALPLNIIGTFILIFYLIAWRKKIIKYSFIECRLVIVTTYDNYFGGVSLGWAIIVSKNSNVLSHELGHTLQYALFGILSYILISIPSVIRYHYRRILYKKDRLKYFRLKPYESIWFEKQATNWGTSLYEQSENLI